jgi:predicted aminopeptidase
MALPVNAPPRFICPAVIGLTSAALALGALCSCRTAKFYAQAVAGQAEMVLKAKPVEKLIADPATSPALAKQLRFTVELRRYAHDRIGLPAEKQYATYADLGRRHAVWVVYAAPEFSLQPVKWTYPIVGQLDYRGFFNEPDAIALGRDLKRKGNDVIVGGVDAYSTLGFFRDPLLNTFIHDPDVDLAELLFHELSHQKIFFAGDTPCNEAFATATAQQAVRQWLADVRRHRDLAAYETSLASQRQFVGFVLAFKRSLDALYTSTALQPEQVRREQKQKMQREFARRLDALPGLRERKGMRKWFSEPVNNARLNTVSTYHQLVPAFEKIFNRCHGDFAAYFSEVRKLKSMTQPERRKFLSGQL